MELFGWGINNYGQLGDGTTIAHNTPTRVLIPGGEANKVSAGGAHVLALIGDKVWAWGLNTDGQLGDGTTNNRTSPVQVGGPGGRGFLADVTAIAAGGSHSVALRTDGTVWAWGSNVSGQLGDGTLETRLSPVQVLGVGRVNFLAEIVTIAAGRSHSLAITSDASGNHVVGWGLNSNAQLGNGTGTGLTVQPIENVPVQTLNANGTPLSGVCDVTAGYLHSLALLCNGSVLGWGNDGAGQLGRGPGGISESNPVATLRTPSAPLINVRQIAAGGSQSFAVMRDGSLLAWGQNIEGYLGDGTVGENRRYPVIVVQQGGIPLTGVSSIAVGPYHALAQMRDGTMRSWGRNNSGEIGDRTNTARTIPVIVRDSTVPADQFDSVGFRLIAAGTDYSLAMKQRPVDFLSLPATSLGWLRQLVSGWLRRV